MRKSGDQIHAYFYSNVIIDRPFTLFLLPQPAAGHVLALENKVFEMIRRSLPWSFLHRRGRESRLHYSITILHISIQSFRIDLAYFFAHMHHRRRQGRILHELPLQAANVP